MTAAPGLSLQHFLDWMVYGVLPGASRVDTGDRLAALHYRGRADRENIEAQRAPVMAQALDTWCDERRFPTGWRSFCSWNREAVHGRYASLSLPRNSSARASSLRRPRRREDPWVRFSPLDEDDFVVEDDFRPLDGWATVPEDAGMRIELPSDWDLVEKVIRRRAGGCRDHEDCRGTPTLARACLEGSQPELFARWP